MSMAVVCRPATHRSLPHLSPDERDEVFPSNGAFHHVVVRTQLPRLLHPLVSQIGAVHDDQNIRPLGSLPEWVPGSRCHSCRASLHSGPPATIAGSVPDAPPD